mmetsp:Transcript_68623/g.191224  ORF Transcript_68623/g.191224 Transcript_68623/m.191224 type:complete len:199 (-) Transcript_68623:935-1531(-)
MFGQSTTSVDTMNESSFSSSDATNARRRMAHDTPSFSLGAGGFDTGEIGAGRGGGYAYAAGGQWLTQYLRRVWSWDQIDYDSTFDQMVTLMGAPKHMSKVYKLANYRKKTKNQWARDDPGFAMIQLGCDSFCCWSRRFWATGWLAGSCSAVCAPASPIDISSCTRCTRWPKPWSGSMPSTSTATASSCRSCSLTSCSS